MCSFSVLRVAVITNALLVTDCELLTLTGALQTGSLGLFKVDPPSDDNQGNCVTINQNEFKALGINDAAYKCARVTSVMAFCFGGLLFVLIFFKQCIIPLPCSQFLMDISSTMVQVSLALVYVIWMSNACDQYYCQYGSGSTYLILTQIFWLAAGCFTRCMREGRWERRDEIRADRERKQEEKKRKAAEDELAQKNAELAAREKELAAREAQAAEP
jgi:hypothetical protein